MEGEISKSLLDNNKCFLLDCGDEIFVWVGRLTQVDERKSASQAAEVVHVLINLADHKQVSCSHFQTYGQEFLSSQRRPKAMRITRVIQGYETHAFKSKFDAWPSGSAAPAEEGRGKVAGKVTSLV